MLKFLFDEHIDINNYKEIVVSRVMSSKSTDEFIHHVKFASVSILPKMDVGLKFQFYLSISNN